MQKMVGQISEKVVRVLGLNADAGTPIYIGETNVQHMKQRHPEDYIKYGDKIPTILSHPD